MGIIGDLWRDRVRTKILVGEIKKLKIHIPTNKKQIILCQINNQLSLSETVKK